MEVLGYTKEFDNDLRINKILDMQYKEIQKLNGSQFASYYDMLADSSALNNVLAKRTLGYHTLLESLSPGSALYANLNKFNFGIHKLVSSRMLKGMRIAPQTYVGSRGSHSTLHTLVDDLKLNVTMDEVMLVDHEVEDGITTLELRGLLTENDYSGQTAINIDPLTLCWENYPLKTGLVAPIVITDLNYAYDFENVIEALMMDKHPFMDITMRNSLTVRENYAIVSSINKLSTNIMNESTTSDSANMDVHTHTYMPFIGSLFFIKTVCIMYGMTYTQAVEEFMVNFFARIDYANPEPTYSLVVNDDDIDSIIADIKDQRFFYNMAIFTKDNDIYKDQYMLVNDIPGTSDDLYSRLTELIVLKQYGLMWFKAYSRNYNLTMQFYKYILDNSNDGAKMFDEGTIILESIKELYNTYFASLIGPTFNPFEYPIRPKVAAKDFIENLDDTVPFYIKLLEISPVDRINTRIVLDCGLFGGTKITKNTTINVDIHQIGENIIQIHTIDLDHNLTSESLSEFNDLIYFDHNIYFKSTNNEVINIDHNMQMAMFADTTIDLDHNITWFSEIVLSEYTKDTWDMFVVNWNSNDIDDDSPLLDSWKVIDENEHDPSIHNFEYEFPIDDHVTGLTTRGKHTDFRLEVNLSSIGESAEDIGVIVARNYAISETNLTVVRSNSDANTWRLIYNWGMDSEAILIDNSINVIEIGDDASGTNYWNGNASGVNIIIERIGNIIKANTSTWNDDTLFEASSIIEIDLYNDDFPDFNEAELADLHNVGSFGFSCRNMAKVRYTDITFTRISTFSF